MDDPGTIAGVEVEITARPAPGMTMAQLRHHIGQLGMSTLDEGEDEDGPYLIMVRTQQEMI